MGAAEDEGVHAFVEERGEVFAEDGFQRGVVGPAFFDEGDEEGGGDGVDLEAGLAHGEGVLIRAAADGAGGADDADALAGGIGKGGLDARLQDADDGDAEGGLQKRQGVGGGGVAGDDDGLDAMADEELGVLHGETADGVGGFGAVRDAGGIAEVDDGFIRKQLPQGADDGEAADAGIKDTEGGGGIRSGHGGGQAR